MSLCFHTLNHPLRPPKFQSYSVPLVQQFHLFRIMLYLLLCFLSMSVLYVFGDKCESMRTAMEQLQVAAEILPARVFLMSFSLKCLKHTLVVGFISKSLPSTSSSTLFRQEIRSKTLYSHLHHDIPS